VCRNGGEVVAKQISYQKQFAPVEALVRRPSGGDRR
jgi:hypothetical protein